MKVGLLSIILLTCSLSLKAQDRILTLDECIEQALQANYSIKIAENDLEILQNNVTLAPFLPVLSAGASQRQSRTYRNEYNSSGDFVDRDTKSDDLGLSATLSWTLFDGMKMFATRKTQQQLLLQGEDAFRSSIQTLVGDILSQYYLIIRMQNQEQLLQEFVAISKIRHDQSLTRYMIGSDSGLEYQQSKIYLNSDSTALLNQQESLANAYIELYRLMNIPLNSGYRIKDTIIKEDFMDLEDLRMKMYENNLSLRRVRSGEILSELDLQIVKSERYPKLVMNSGYNLGYSSNTYFNNRFDNSNGFNWGFTLSVPVFSGNDINRRIRNAGISRETARLTYMQAEQSMEAQLLKLYNTYLNNLRLIDFENENTQAAYMNLDAAMEKYRLGSLSGIEFREIQTSYLNASASKLNAQYNTKITEIQLHIVAGDLF